MTDLEQVQTEQSNEENVSQETIEKPQDWTADKRFSSFGNKPEMAISEMYKMLKGYDKTYTPIQMAIKKYGINDSKSLEQTLEEYKGLKDPNNDINKLIDYLRPVLADQKRLPAFQQTIEKMKQEIDREKFGSNLSPEEIQALKAGQEANERLAQLEEEREVERIEQAINKSVSDIKTYAEKNNLQFETKEFLDYCQNNQVPSHLMMDVFMAKAKPFIVNNESRKAEENVMRNLEENKRGGIGVGNKSNAPASKPNSYKSGMDAILAKAYPGYVPD